MPNKSAGIIRFSKLELVQLHALLSMILGNWDQWEDSFLGRDGLALEQAAHKIEVALGNCDA